jgi:hypothetical protein
MRMAKSASCCVVRGAWSVCEGVGSVGIVLILT